MMSPDRMGAAQAVLMHTSIQASDNPAAALAGTMLPNTRVRVSARLLLNCEPPGKACAV